MKNKVSDLSELNSDALKKDQSCVNIEFLPTGVRDFRLFLKYSSSALGDSTLIFRKGNVKNFLIKKLDFDRKNFHFELLTNNSILRLQLNSVYTYFLFTSSFSALLLEPIEKYFGIFAIRFVIGCLTTSGAFLLTIFHEEPYLIFAAWQLIGCASTIFIIVNTKELTVRN